LHGSHLLTSSADQSPIVLITGATGNLGRSLGKVFGRDYRTVGLDRVAEGTDFPVIPVDFTSDASMELAFRKFRDAFGSRIASVIHLVAYFDFTGEEHPLYRSVTVEGTRRLLRALQEFEVEQFVYASTMLVHAPCRPGERIDERQPIDPRWAYPRSKAAAEEVIRREHGPIPDVILRLAGVYDRHTTVPTMAQQMARVYERNFQSHFYSGSTLVGQAHAPPGGHARCLPSYGGPSRCVAASCRDPDRRSRCC
jgi:nucleoside-diphosphate-sugar epimerase